MRNRRFLESTALEKAEVSSGETAIPVGADMEVAELDSSEELLRMRALILPSILPLSHGRLDEKWKKRSGHPGADTRRSAHR